MIVGKVRIGDDVNIGPNAVVLTDVPSHATVMAPMSKIMRRPRPEQVPPRSSLDNQ
jgi:serine O-acetyltransferase